MKDSNNFTKLYIYVQQLNSFTLNSTLSLLFFRKCAHMAIHVTFSMINSLVHSFCKCLCALWEILKQRKTQTKKYHDKYKPNYHPYKNASTQLPHSMLLAGENVSSGKSNSACPILSTSISGRGSPLNAFIAETIVLAPIHFHARFTRDLLFYFQKYIFNNIEENELFLLDIFFLKRVLSWHVSWETI